MGLSNLKGSLRGSLKGSKGIYRGVEGLESTWGIMGLSK